MTAIEHDAGGGPDCRPTAGALAQVYDWVRRYCLARLMGTPQAARTANLVTQGVCADARAALHGQRAQLQTLEAFAYQGAVNKLRYVERSQATGAPQARDLMAGLPEQLREVLLLRTAAGLTAEQTGRALGLSTEAVKVAQHRALQLLRGAGRSQKCSPTT